MAGLNERQMERFTLQISANLVVSEDDAAKEITLETSDISSGGAFFSTQQPLPIGTPVQIDMVLPLDELKKIKGKKAKIEVSGSVIRADQGGMAVTFNRNYKVSRLTNEK